MISSPTIIQEIFRNEEDLNDENYTGRERPNQQRGLHYVSADPQGIQW